MVLLPCAGYLSHLLDIHVAELDPVPFEREPHLSSKPTLPVGSGQQEGQAYTDGKGDLPTHVRGCDWELSLDLVAVYPQLHLRKKQGIIVHRTLQVLIIEPSATRDWIFFAG